MARIAKAWSVSASVRSKKDENSNRFPYANSAVYIIFSSLDWRIEDKRSPKNFRDWPPHEDGEGWDSIATLASGTREARLTN